ncbi:MAG: SpoIIE family protein phosphatase [Desulfovibrionaceae bacterium]|nr:SpoIIE family protein phosphatase [Desulfovibrionaceae bacterium]
MRIRWKLLIFLLVLVLPPIFLVRWYSIRETRALGTELAGNAAAVMRDTANRELAQTVNLFAEAVNDSRDVLELALTLQARETERLLAERPPHIEPIFFDTDYDRRDPRIGVLEPPRILPDSSAAHTAKSNIPITTDHMVFRLSPDADIPAALRDAQALTRLLPLLRIIYLRHDDLMLWSYVSLDNGLHCAYPGHGGYPPDYDPRRREWYTQAKALGRPVWSIMVDANTQRTIATLSMPIHAPNGSIIGVTGVDFPLDTLLLESDLSRRWTPAVRSILLRPATESDGDPNAMLIVAMRDYIDHDKDWKTPMSLERLENEDQAAVAAMREDIKNGRQGIVEMPYQGVESVWSFKPVIQDGLTLAVIVPSEVIVASSRHAEDSVMERTKRMLRDTSVFALVINVLLVAAAAVASLAVTRPIARLARAAGRIAEGDLSARAVVKSHDELGDLAKAFNDMAPKLLERIKLKNDMALAMEVQRNLLPERPPVIPGLDIAAVCQFCDETGGDYYDFLSFSRERGDTCDVVLGDVTGHGISAALFMATGRALLHARADEDSEPARCITMVNRLLCRDTQLSGRFITLFFLSINLLTGVLTWVRAGHDPALVYDPDTNTFDELMGAGIPLGVEECWEYTDNRRDGITAGQLLVLGTDGIWEAMNPAGEMFGKERFKDILSANAHKTAQEVVDAVVAAVMAFVSPGRPEDDLTLVVIKALR